MMISLMTMIIIIAVVNCDNDKFSNNSVMCSVTVATNKWLVVDITSTAAAKTAAYFVNITEIK